MPDNPIILDVQGDGLSLTLDTQPYSKGDPGESAYQIAVNNGFVGSQAEWLNSLKGADGTDGTDGSGISSIAKTSTSGLLDTYTITLEDGNTSTFTVTNGEQGPQGIQGIQGNTGPRGVAGNDGFSPTATVSKSGDTATISITDKNGTTTATVKDGADGSTDWSDITNKPTFATVATSGSYADLSNKPAIPTVPTDVSAFNNDAGYLTSYTETDPTVPSWAKASSKPSYTKSEVGLGNVDNVKQYSASNPPPYPVTSVNGSTGAITGLQTTGNLVTSVSSASTNSQYPSAKCVYDLVGNIETLLASI